VLMSLSASSDSTYDTAGILPADGYPAAATMSGTPSAISSGIASSSPASRVSARSGRAAKSRAYDDLPQHLMDRLEPALQTLLARAVDGGYARDDVTAREVLMTIALICQPVRGEQPSFNQRMTRVFMEGLGRVAKAGVEPAEDGGQAECGVVAAGGLV
jgi:hypothetical protein